MTLQEVLGKGMQFLNICAIYYGMQLMRCALISLGVSAGICVLRKTVLRDSVFLKGALWSLFIPVLFVGKLKFFYENTIGIILFSWWTEFFKLHVWVYWLYIGGVVVYALLLCVKRRNMKKLTAGMEKRNVGDTVIYVTKLPVTPSAIGVLRPKIVMPEIMLECYNSRELQTILLHEKTHIRLGHLWFYFLWDVLRALLWMNPLLAAGTRFLREDLEEICDWVTIHKSKSSAYAYGQLLLKSMKVLKAESEEFNLYANFAGDKEFQNICQRMRRIACFGAKRYQKLSSFLVPAFTIVCVLGAVIFIHSISYGRWNENDSVLVYGYDIESGTADLFTDDELQEMISYDESHVFIDRSAFEKFLRDSHVLGEVFIVFGGYFKLPGFVGYGYSCCYEPDSVSQVVKLPYDKPEEDWMLTLIRVM